MRELPNEEGDAVRECEAMHEENFKGGKEEKRRGERKGRSAEDVRVLFLWRPEKFLVKAEIWRVTRILLVKSLWIGKSPWRV